MKVLKPDAIPAEPANSPLFTSGPVTRQTLLTPEMSSNFNLAVVNFSAGARNKMHIHSSDQVLFVTAGKGIIATETRQEVISVGDIAHIPAEEKTLAWGNARFLLLPHCVDGQGEHDHAGGRVSQLAQAMGLRF